MSRRTNEQEVIKRFLPFLRQVTGQEWEPSPDEVSTGKNNRFYDCEFTSLEVTPIAADICRLFPRGSNQGQNAARQTLNERLLRELRTAGRGGLLIKTPFIPKNAGRPKWLQAMASSIADTLSNPGAVSGEIDCDGFKIQRVGDNSEALTFWSGTYRITHPIRDPGFALDILLQNKLEQLDVDGHSRYLIVVNDGCGASASQVRDACAFIDFTKYPNFDRIYFEETPKQPFSLVYDQEAWQMMKRCVLPSNEGLRGLVVSWIEAQLAGRWPVAMDAALSICCDLHSDEWLTDEGKSLLETAGQSFLQDCNWETPRAFWKFFRGPLPSLFNGRRRTAPIS